MSLIDHDMSWTPGYKSVVKDLSTDIDQHHKAFLTSEGIPKEESLILLRVHAIDFLCVVPHVQKFKFRETESVITASVAVDDFNPVKTSDAFEALAKYAHNLLEQPWRKDFHRIKTTSGFWQHNIVSRLPNAQEMMGLLGYVANDPDTLVLLHPSPPSRLAALSCDCYIASQECLILSQIWDSLLKDIPCCPLTLKDVFEARRNFVGDMRTIADHLKAEVRRRRDEDEEVKAHLRENGLLPTNADDQSDSPPVKLRTFKFVPTGILVDIPDPPFHEHEVPPREEIHAEEEYMDTLTIATSPPAPPSTSALVSDLLRDQTSTSSRSNGWKSSANGVSKSPPSPLLPGTSSASTSDYLVNFDRTGIGNGKVMTKSIISDDFHSTSSSHSQSHNRERGGSGTGILGKIWDSVPPMQLQKKLGQFFGIDESPWDCPHCTFVNHHGNKICKMCSKTRDFRPPLPDN